MIWSTPSSRNAQVAARSEGTGGIVGLLVFAAILRLCLALVVVIGLVLVLR